MSHTDLLTRAAKRIWEVAEAATPGPWRDSSTEAGVAYSALVSDTRPSGRPVGGGWDEDAPYGGYLIAESLNPQDRAHVAMWHPLIALHVAQWLDEVATSGEVSTGAMAVSRLILGID